MRLAPISLRLSSGLIIAGPLCGTARQMINERACQAEQADDITADVAVGFIVAPVLDIGMNGVVRMSSRLDWPDPSASGLDRH